MVGTHMDRLKAIASELGRPGGFQTPATKAAFDHAFDSFGTLAAGRDARDALVSANVINSPSGADLSVAAASKPLGIA